MNERVHLNDSHFDPQRLSSRPEKAEGFAKNIYVIIHLNSNTVAMLLYYNIFLKRMANVICYRL